MDSLAYGPLTRLYALRKLIRHTASLNVGKHFSGILVTVRRRLTECFHYDFWPRRNNFSQRCRVSENDLLCHFCYIFTVKWLPT